MRLVPGSTLVLASHNAGKLREIGALVAPWRLDVRAASDFGLPEPAETENTFEGNALLKARFSARGSGHTALADDSGLVVPALDGAPGVWSADWAGVPRDFGRAMDRVRAELAARGQGQGTPAHFVCVLALANSDGQEVVFRGEVHGTLAFPPRGSRGFGYDPIFVPDGHGETFGEMDPAAKHAMSHRAAAFARLVATLGPPT
jgi:XTP/dITP diphosphohydrolase